MGFKAWLRDFLGQEKELYVDGQIAASTAADQLALSIYADKLAIQKIAQTVAKCELVTFEKNVRTKKDEWYLWNVEPNANQNGAQFKYKLVEKLLKDGKALVVEVNGNLYIADNYNYHNEYAIREHYFDNVQVNDLTFSGTFPMSQVIFLQYDNQEINKWLQLLLAQYDKLLTISMSKYRRSGGRKGFMRLGAAREGNEEKNNKIEDNLSNRLKRFYDSENAILVLNKGMEYTPDNSEGSKRTASEVNDIKAVSHEIFSRVAQARSIPMAVLLGENNDTSAAHDVFFEEAIKPILELISTEIQRKRFGKDMVINGTYAKFDMSGAKYINVLKEASNIDKLLACGMYSIDQLLDKVDDPPINTKWSTSHFITKNYQLITTAYSEKGGENGEGT